MKHLIIGALIAASSFTSFAQENATSIGLHLGSWHSQPGYNNQNFGIYVQHNGIVLGVYRNSIKPYCSWQLVGYNLVSNEGMPYTVSGTEEKCTSPEKVTAYAGYNWEWKTPSLPLIDSVGITAALATGYPNKIKGTPVSLIVTPSATINITEDIRTRVSFLPKMWGNSTAVVHFSIEKSF